MGKVVIVDNDLVALSLFEQMLEQYVDQYDIEFIHEPEEALSILEHEDVYVLISELNMPLFSGSELFSFCNDVSPKTIQVGMTKVENVQDTLQIVNECNLYKLILKPIHFSEDLVSVIENALTFYEIQQIGEWIEEEGEDRIGTVTAEYSKQQDWLDHKEATFRALREMVLSLVERDFEGSDLDGFTKTSLIDYFDRIMHNFTECFCCSFFSADLLESIIKDRFMNEQKNLLFYNNAIKDQDDDFVGKLAFSIYVFLYTCDRMLDGYQLIISMEEKAERFMVKAVCQQFHEKQLSKEMKEQLFFLGEQFIKIYFDQVVIGYGENPYVMVAIKNKQTEEI